MSREPYILPSQRPVPINPSLYAKGSFWRNVPAGRLENMLRNAIRRAKVRSYARGSEKVGVTVADLINLFERQEGRCVMTGVTFSLEPAKGTWRNPHAPSLDRIDLSIGYVPGNCRLITLIANVARSDFGDDAFYEMCTRAVEMRARSQTKRRGRPKTVATPAGLATARRVNGF